MKNKNKQILLGIGKGSCHTEKQLNKVLSNNKKLKLYRAVCEAEYEDIRKKGMKFCYYPYGMEIKWFATNYEHAIMWGESLYPNGIYRILEMTILNTSLQFMFYVKYLDNIGPAYAADVDLLNKIMKKVKLV